MGQAGKSRAGYPARRAVHSGDARHALPEEVEKRPQRIGNGDG